MPPAPMRTVISYGPRRVPESSAMGTGWNYRGWRSSPWAASILTLQVTNDRRGNQVGLLGKHRMPRPWYRSHRHSTWVIAVQSFCVSRCCDPVLARLQDQDRSRTSAPPCSGRRRVGRRSLCPVRSWVPSVLPDRRIVAAPEEDRLDGG